MLKDEPERRKKIKEQIKKEVNTHLPNVLAEIVSEYVPLCPSLPKKDDELIWI